MGDVEDPPTQPGVGRQQGWLGSLLSRRGSGGQIQKTAVRGSSVDPMTQFSPITEESGHYSWSGVPAAADQQGPSVSSNSMSVGGNLSRKAPIPKVADPLGLVQASSMQDNKRAASAKTTPAASSAAASSASTARSVATQQRALGDVVIGRPSAAVKVSEEATKKYMNMAEEDIEVNLSSSRNLWDKGIIHPLDRRYRIWWYITVLAAAITGWLIPFRIGYLNTSYHDAHLEGATALEIVLMCVFAADMAVSFCVAYYDHQGLLVVKRKEVALHYIKHRFLLDLITTIPFDAIALAATGAGSQTEFGRYLSLLGWLKIGRMYRVAVMFQHMSFNLNFGLLALTLLRNLTFCFFLLHWAACTFWFIALQEGQHEMTWVGQEQEILQGRSTVEKYIFSFYWAIVTFATLGYGDVTPSTTAEIVFVVIYVAVNIIVWAYILGTITLLVTKQDEETGTYRARMSALGKYCTANNLSPDLKHTMAGLLRLHMSLQNETLDDEQVLSVYPTTIRRKILRQLYSAPLHECYLFEQCGVKFLDALMLGARVELFLPKVEIVSALDHVNEVYVVMAGHVELVPPTTLTGSSADNSRAGTGAGTNNAAITTTTTTYGPGGDSVELTNRVYRIANNKHNGSAQKLNAAHADQGTAGTAADGRADVDESRLGGTENASWWRKGGLNSGRSDDKQQQQVQRQQSGQRRGFVLDSLPGFRRLQRWWSDIGTISHDWRHGHEQLQRDKQSLARASKMVTLASSSPMPSGRVSGVRADAMPAYAMKHLDSRSRMPLRNTSVGRSSASDSVRSAAMQVPADVADEPSNPILGPGDCFAEVAYFTEVPKAEAVRSLTVCRVLVIPRSTYNAVARDFPLSARQVLMNLKNRAAEMVAQFLTPELAAQCLAQVDLGSPTARAAAAAAAHDIATVEDLTPAPLESSQRAAPLPQQQEGKKAGEPQQQRRPEASQTFGDSAAATAAAAAAATDEFRRLSVKSSDRSSSRPVLSSMSVQLHSRYNTPSSPRRSEDSAGPTAAAAAAAAAAGFGASRQARALNRFRSMGAANKWHNASGTAAAALRDSRNPLQSTSADAVRGHSVGGAAAAAAVWEGGPAAAGFRGTGSGRGLGTMSLLPGLGNARVARAIEGMKHNADQQQWQQQSLNSRSAGGAGSSAVNAADTSSSNVAAAAGSSSPGGDDEHRHGDENNRHPKFFAPSRLAINPEQRIYSDEQLQAAAAAAADKLTLQQQSMLFDLLKIRQLVNKAAARFDQQRLTAFLDAAAGGEVEVIQDMLRQGVSPNTADYDGRTALMIAAHKGHKDVVLNLLFVGADTTLKDARGFDVMIEAARGGHVDVLEVLTRSGAKTGISSVLQSQLLCKATYEGKLDRLSHLLKAGCQPDAHDYDGQTALHVAAADGNLAAARILVTAGASPTLKDRWRYSPLDLAHKVGAAPLVDYFNSVVSPEDAAAAADNWKRERTEAALAAARYGDVPALHRLVERGCPVDAADYDGRTLLHVAVTNKQAAVVDYLLAAGANPNATNSAGSSPLLEAAMNSSSNIQAALMNAGARLNLPSTEEAALLSSVLHQGRHDQLLALLTAGANPAAADYDSRTPLHIAASVGDVEALELLAAAVADSSIERLTAVNWAARDRWGDTPLQEALRAGHEAAAAFLKQMEQQQQQIRSGSAAAAAAAGSSHGVDISHVESVVGRQGSGSPKHRTFHSFTSAR